MVNDALPENLSLLKNLFHKQFLVDGDELIEENTDCTGKPFKMKVTLKPSKGLSFLIFKFENETINLFPYFSNVRGLKSMCDYVVLVEDAKYLYAFLFELKGSKHSAKLQLDVSETFVNFAMKRFDVIDKKIDKPFKLKKVAIKKNRSNKQTTQGFNHIGSEEDGIIRLYRPNSIRLLHLTRSMS